MSIPKTKDISFAIQPDPVEDVLIREPDEGNLQVLSVLMF